MYIGHYACMYVLYYNGQLLIIICPSVKNVQHMRLIVHHSSFILSPAIMGNGETSSA